MAALPPPGGMMASPWPSSSWLGQVGPAAAAWNRANGSGQQMRPFWQTPLTPAQLEGFKREEAIRLADRFCRASIQRWGANEHEMKLTLKQVARQRLQADFNVAVRTLALQHGVLVRDTGEAVNQELGGNFLTQFFKAAPRKACLDYLNLGRNTHSATPWEYRRYGMYRSGADFVNLCKRHPAISAIVIGAVSYLGDRFPFVGAASGVGLMAWAAVMSAVSEYKATKYSVMNGPKARCYETSGENLAAIFMSLPGYHGITEGMRGGLGRFKEVAVPPKATRGEAVLNTPKGIWHAVKLDKDSEDFARLSKPVLKAGETSSEPKKGSWMSWLNRGLFVAGLFDNVLLPFNWLADKLEDKD